jgi:hypothetical protein
LAVSEDVAARLWNRIAKIAKRDCGAALGYGTVDASVRPA